MSFEEGLRARWTFENESACSCREKLKVSSKAVIFGERGPGKSAAAKFDGETSVMEVSPHPCLDTRKGDFTLSCSVFTDESARGGDVVGDIFSCFDPESRKGFNLSVVTNGGVTSCSQSNYRNIHFGIDCGRVHGFEDCGRPGEAVFVKALATIQGNLYAGTFEIEAGQAGKFYRYEGNTGWSCLGATPDNSNSVSSMVFLKGGIYVASGMYGTQGSLLGAPRNANPGGHVYLVNEDGRWIDCGRPGEDYAADAGTPFGAGSGRADSAASLTVYRGNLYCTSINQRGVFIYEGGKNWKLIGPDSRIMTLAIFCGRLYALANRGMNTQHGGAVYRYEKDNEWTFCGRLGKATQVYGSAVHEGSFYAGTWPDCEVYRYVGDTSWEKTGRLGYEMEVMAMAVYNGKMYAGTLPMANIWRYDKGAGFTFMGNADNSAVALRRAWSMSVYRGALFIGTLPSGRVKRFRAGVMASHDTALAPGWRHVAAVRAGSRLKIYVDGVQAAESEDFNPSDYDLPGGLPLRIGAGQHARFSGLISDLRFYGCALTSQQIGEIACDSL